MEAVNSAPDKMAIRFGGALLDQEDIPLENVDLKLKKDEEVEAEQTWKFSEFMKDDLKVGAGKRGELVQKSNGEEMENEKTPEQIIPVQLLPEQTCHTDHVILEMSGESKIESKGPEGEQESVISSESLNLIYFEELKDQKNKVGSTEEKMEVMEAEGKLSGNSETVNMNGFKFVERAFHEDEVKNLKKDMEEVGRKEEASERKEGDAEEEEEEEEEDDNVGENDIKEEKKEEDEDICLLGIDSRVYAQNVRIVEEYEEKEESLDSLLILKHGRYEDEDEKAMEGNGDEAEEEEEEEEEVKEIRTKNKMKNVEKNIDYKCEKKKNEINEKNQEIDNGETKNNEYLYWKSDVIKNHLESFPAGTILTNSYNQIRSFSITAKFDEKNLINDSYNNKKYNDNNNNGNSTNYFSSNNNYMNENLQIFYEIVKSWYAVTFFNFLSIFKYIWISIPYYILTLTYEINSYSFNIAKKIMILWFSFLLWFFFLPIQFFLLIFCKIIEAHPLGKKIMKIIKKEWKMFMIERTN